MVMLSIQLCKVVPFKKILLHGIVRDAHGKKMSKSLGNVIDPIFVIEGISLKDLNNKIENVDKKEKERAINAQKKDFPNGIPQCGADALRFGLCAYFNGVKDINLDVLRVEGYRRFCNKIWNAFKFVKMCMSNSKTSANTNNDFTKAQKQVTNVFNDSHIVWIMHKRNETIKILNESIKNYNFMNATQVLYKFFLNDFCDIFIEIVKKRKDDISIAILEYVFGDIIKMLHPFMPFITEEIYQRMKKDRNIDEKDSVSVSQFPKVITEYDNIVGNIENDTTHVQKCVKIFEDVLLLKKGIRSILDSHNIKKSKVEIQNKSGNLEINSSAILDYLKVFIKGENLLHYTENVSGEFIDCIEEYKIGITDNEKCERDEK